MSESLSYGQKLFRELNIKQGRFFYASFLHQEEEKREWSEFFINRNSRGKIKHFKEKSIFVVLSQDCDIAHHNDNVEGMIELVLCKKILAKEMYPGNQFVQSVRKLHFKLEDKTCYEANVDYILLLKKEELYHTLKEEHECSFKLPENILKQIPIWRANRYNRTAFPDNFNEKFYPIAKQYLAKFDLQTQEYEQDIASDILAFYIKLDTLEERETYHFAFLALLNDEISDEAKNIIQNYIEAMALKLEQDACYIDQSEIYAERAQYISVSTLVEFVRFNFDYISLEGEDNKFDELKLLP